jgi:hypothetical protein
MTFVVKRYDPEPTGQLRYLKTPKGMGAAPAIQQEQERTL